MILTEKGWNWQEYRKRTLCNEPLTGDYIEFNWLQAALWQCWLAVLRIFAPGNLNIREYVLRDLKRKRPKHARKIMKLISILAPNELWLEGASYWFEDTLSFLNAWMENFPFTSSQIVLPKMINTITDNFRKLSYKDSQGIWRTPPMGDVYNRKIPALQGEREERYGKIGNVEKSLDEISKRMLIYNISPAPVRLNWHCPATKNYWVIWDGEIEKYVCYTGNTDKYPAIWAEIRNTFRWCRIKNLLGVKC